LTRPLKLILIVTAAAASPLAAAAQTWPVSVVAAAPRTAPASRPALVIVTRDGPVLRRGSLPTTTRIRPPLHLRAVDPEDLPQVDLRAKDEWLDDQGFRVAPTRVAFKQRF